MGWVLGMVEKAEGGWGLVGTDYEGSGFEGWALGVIVKAEGGAG